MTLEQSNMDGSNHDPSVHRRSFSWKRMVQFMGPGWVMSLAYLDPGNLEADLQQGAYTNMSLLWVLWGATCAGLLLQELSSRLCVVSGFDLAEVSKQHYSKPTGVILYCMMELAIIGSDIQEVVGSAIAFHILFGWPLWVGCLVTGLDTFTFLAIYAYGARYFETMIGFLISLIVACFFFNFTTTNIPPSMIAMGMLPTMPKAGMVTAMGTLGSVIMPHNLYLHSGLIKSRIQNIDRSDTAALAEANYYSFIESALALLVSFFVNFFVVGTFAHFFYAPICGNEGLACVPNTASTVLPTSEEGGGGGDSSSMGRHCFNDAISFEENAVCGEIGLDDAGDALKAAIGSSALVVWAIGVLAAGQASTMSTTFAGQVVTDGFLDLKLKPWQRVTFTRLASLGPSMLIAIFTSDHAGVRNAINEWLNILQSIQLPFAIIPVLTFTSSRMVMGPFANRGSGLMLAIILTIIVLIANVYLVMQFISTHPTIGIWINFMSCILGILYFGFVLHLLSYAYQHLRSGDSDWRLVPSREDGVEDQTKEEGLAAAVSLPKHANLLSKGEVGKETDKVLNSHEDKTSYGGV